MSDNDSGTTEGPDASSGIGAGPGTESGSVSGSGSKDETKVPRATLEQKLQIIDDFHTLKRPQLDIVNKYRYTVSILTSSFSEWLKHEQELRERFNQAGYPSQRRSRRRAKFKYEKINRAMDMMVKQRLDRNEPISEPILRGYWSIFAHQYGVDDPKRLVGFSHGWLAQFKQRHGLNRKRMNGSSYVYEKDPSSSSSSHSQQGSPEGETEHESENNGNILPTNRETELAISLSKTDSSLLRPNLKRMGSGMNPDPRMDLQKSTSDSQHRLAVSEAFENSNSDHLHLRKISPHASSSRDRLSPRREPMDEQIKRKNNFELLQPQASEVLKPDIEFSASLLPENTSFADSERNNLNHLLHVANSNQELPGRSIASLPPPTRPLSTQSTSRNQFKPQVGLSFNSSSSNFHHSKSMTSLGPPKQPLTQHHAIHNHHGHRHHPHSHLEHHSRRLPEKRHKGTSSNDYNIEEYRQQVYSQNLVPDNSNEKHSNSKSESIPRAKSRNNNDKGSVANTSSSSIAFLLGDSVEGGRETIPLEQSTSASNTDYTRSRSGDRGNLRNDETKGDQSSNERKGSSDTAASSVISANEVERFMFVFADRFFLDHQYDYPQTVKLFHEFKNSFLNERIILERAQRDSSNSKMRQDVASSSTYYESLPHAKRVKSSIEEPSHIQHQQQNDPSNSVHRHTSTDDRINHQERPRESYQPTTTPQVSHNTLTSNRANDNSIPLDGKEREGRSMMFQFRANGALANSGQLEDYVLPGSPTGSITGMNKNKLFMTALTPAMSVDQESAITPSVVPPNLNLNMTALSSTSPSSTSIGNLTATPSFLRLFSTGGNSAQSPPTLNTALNPALSPITTTPTVTEGKFIGLGGGAIRSPSTSQLPPPIRSFSPQNSTGNYNNSIMRLLDASSHPKR